MSKNPQTAVASSESDLRFRVLFDSAAEFIFVIDADGFIQLTNRYVSEQSGYRAEELAGRHIKDFFTDDSKALCECNFPGLRRHGHSRAETEFVCKDGRVLQMECVATAIPDRRGKFTSFLIIQRDITERKRAAAELADSERKFRAIFNSTFQFIGVLSPDGIMLAANRPALQSIDAREADVVGKPFWDTPWWAGLPDEQERLKEAVADAARGQLVRYETRHIDRDGKLIHIDFSLKPVRSDSGGTLFLIPEGRDISERRRAEETTRRHLREQAHLMRLSLMGEMAASIAHELNQPLTALISYCGTAYSQLQDIPSVPENLHKLLSHANEQAHRASGIIQQIRSFVGKDEIQKRPIDIDLTITNMSKLLDWELNNSEVNISFDLDATGRRIMANSVQIEQVLLNLIRNSIEAIHNAGIDNGRIILRTRAPDNEWLVINAQDNGPGIEPAMRGHLFEAFQTSKESGMGMGLSTSRSIIQEHGGKIRLDSSGPEGTTFSIMLPLLEEDHAQSRHSFPG